MGRVSNPALGGLYFSNENRKRYNPHNNTVGLFKVEKLLRYKISVFNIKICKCLVSTKTIMSNFQPLGVVDRGSETQLRVGENLN